MQQGLEFDDVFLLNFFSDSPAVKEWRVLMSYLEELEQMVHPLKFLSIRMFPICLKRCSTDGYLLWYCPSELGVQTSAAIE